MPDDAVQIFISYARDDNEPPPGIPGAKGFVEFLHEQLKYKFKTSGPLRPALWRDTDNIADGEPFPSRLEQELDKSSLLLVVLSPNWMDREFCRRELEYFRECRERCGEPIDERIVVVEKIPVDLSSRPVGIRNQVGYRFYRQTGRPVRPIEEYFDHGEPIANLYWPVFGELFAHLLAACARLGGSRPSPSPTNGRTVFVAKTASDMFDEYIRVVAELTAKGYEVVPKRASEIPRDASAASFIDAELAKAEASVHLLGDSAGWKPEGLDEIVKLQLARAAARVGTANAAGAANRPFRRIVWAPKVFRSGGRPDSEAVRRDPQDVLSRFAADCPDDIVFGDDLGNFRDFLVSHLDKQKTPLAPADEPGELSAAPRGRVLVLHHENDRELARGLRKALMKLNVEAVFPARDGDEVERKNFDKAMLKSCDAIVICWGATSETWTRAQASQLENWRALGRSQAWRPRSVVLGPPPGSFKAEFKEDGPPGDIDEVVVVDDLQAIPPDEIRKLIPRRPPAQP